MKHILDLQTYMPDGDNAGKNDDKKIDYDNIKQKIDRPVNNFWLNTPAQLLNGIEAIGETTTREILEASTRAFDGDDFKKELLVYTFKDPESTAKKRKEVADTYKNKSDSVSLAHIRVANYYANFTINSELKLVPERSVCLLPEQKKNLDKLNAKPDISSQLSKNYAESIKKYPTEIKKIDEIGKALNIDGFENLPLLDKMYAINDVEKLKEKEEYKQNKDLLEKYLKLLDKSTKVANNPELAAAAYQVVADHYKHVIEPSISETLKSSEYAENEIFFANKANALLIESIKSFETESKDLEKVTKTSALKSKVFDGYKDISLDHKEVVKSIIEEAFDKSKELDKKEACKKLVNATLAYNFQKTLDYLDGFFDESKLISSVEDVDVKFAKSIELFPVDAIHDYLKKTVDVSEIEKDQKQSKTKVLQDKFDVIKKQVTEITKSGATKESKEAGFTAIKGAIKEIQAVLPSKAFVDNQKHPAQAMSKIRRLLNIFVKIFFSFVSAASHLVMKVGKHFAKAATKEAIEKFESSLERLANSKKAFGDMVKEVNKAVDELSKVVDKDSNAKDEIKNAIKALKDSYSFFIKSENPEILSSFKVQLQSYAKNATKEASDAVTNLLKKGEEFQKANDSVKDSLDELAVKAGDISNKALGGLANQIAKAQQFAKDASECVKHSSDIANKHLSDLAGKLGISQPSTSLDNAQKQQQDNQQKGASKS